MRAARAEAARWLLAAREDLAYARHAATGAFHAPACFFSQQAAEKAIKSVHYARGARAVIGHNLRALIENLDPPEPDVRELLEVARELDLLYVPARYPNGLAEGTPGEAFSATQSDRAIGSAEAIVEAAARVLER
jgi:HEPN domain-containing protein